MKKLLSTVLALVLCPSTALTVFGAENKGILPSGVSYSNIESVIDAYVEEHRDTTAAVSVAVFTGSDVLMEKAYGYSDIENAVVNDEDTVFEWGSITKLITWTSVMQLAEKGKINLNADIRTYLPENFLKKLKFDTPVTMLNLMNHNAGWQETVTDLFIKDKKDVVELDDALRLIEPEQVHEPGTVVSYSNWGAALAGYIVERVSGQSFDDYVHEHIFMPLGMEHTALSATLSDNEWVAQKRGEEKCYTTENKSLGTGYYYLSLYPAGGTVGTLRDFIKFGQAFLPVEGEKSPLFEKRETLEEMLSPSLFFADGTKARNYHGFWADEFSVPVLWHNGGTTGSSSWFAFDPESGTGMAIFTNQSGESVYNCGLLRKVFGKYEVGGTAAAAEDISGMYVQSKTVFKGFAKPYSLACFMQLVSKGQGRYTIPGPDYTVTAIGTNSFLMDRGGLKQDIIYVSTNEYGNTVLQLPGMDLIEVNGYGVIAEYALLVLFILAALYGFVSLIASFIRFLKYKRFIGTIEKYRIIVNASVVAALIMFIYISLKLFPGFAQLKEVQWSVMLNGVFALVPMTYAVTLVIRWRSFDCTRKEKRKLIMTGIAGLIMTANVIFWQAYKLW